MQTSFAAEEQSAAVPEYRFEVGQELVYRGFGEYVYERGSFLNADILRFFVIGRNPDGVWQVLIRHASLSGRVGKDKDANAAKAKLKQAVEKLGDGENEAGGRGGRSESSRSIETAASAVHPWCSGCSRR